ncbi:hypothetical protein SAMN05216299_1179 [Nitrosospira sp. Nsp14]|uniref:hypothetical protein n=1 Tax=Nitrosospira sp. Nsp14 TaxID=1855333 RepID=UPI0008EFE1CF|nr:hypothetical protein [Nitrosospira sp. Nsp14]SFH49986.1 hypothetical protein SAMN05216299_1179 [Nitrosospira sp. Nsp14]
MAIPPQLLAQVLRTPKTQDVTESPIVRAIILSDPSNAAELVEPLEESQTLEAYNARRILCLFEQDAVPPLLGKLGTAGLNARKEGLEVLWALLATEEARTVREVLSTVKPDLDKLLDDTRSLPDDMPEYIERDFRGRICDLAYIVISQLINPQFDQSLFRSLDDRGRNEEIRRFKARGIPLNIA